MSIGWIHNSTEERDPSINYPGPRTAIWKTPRCNIILHCIAVVVLIHKVLISTEAQHNALCIRFTSLQCRNAVVGAETAIQVP